jgi:hypothetical protein
MPTPPQVREVTQSFPGLKLLAAKYTEITKRPYKYGRYAIIEPIVLWHAWFTNTSSWHHPNGTGKGSTLAGRQLKDFWILEQDVACSNPTHIAQQLLAKYADDPFDLITAMPINETKFAVKARNQGSVGFHGVVQSPAFALAFPKPEVSLRTAPIFVMRWSNRLVGVLAHATKMLAMHAWAEIAAPSLCRRANLSIGALRLAHRGALFHACCTKHVKTTSRNFLPDERRFALRVNMSVAKLYHPVKF